MMKILCQSTKNYSANLLDNSIYMCFSTADDVDIQKVEDINDAVPRMCNIIAGSHWRNTATAIRNIQEI